METNQNQFDEIEIDLQEVVIVLLSKLWLILLVGILTAAIGFGLSAFLIPPSYESTTKIYVLNRQNEGTVTYSDVQLGTQLTKDYEELVQSRFVLEKVIDELSLDMDYEGLLQKIDVEAKTDTRILAITVTDHDPVLAMEVANSIRENAAEHIQNVMDIEAVNVVESANLPLERSSPRIGIWTLLGGLMGMLLVMAVVLLRYFMDDTVKTSDDIEKYLGLSTLALIPMDNRSTRNSRKK